MEFSNEIMLIIFNNLNLMDRIRMRLVCKRWKLIVDYTYRINDLVICDDYGLNNRWWNTFELIDYRDNIVFSLNLSYPTHLLNNLRRLKVKLHLNSVDLKRLERFSRLEHLEIGTLELIDRDETINLINLKSFYVRHILRDESKGHSICTINSPGLRSVYFGDNAINFISILDPSSVQYIEFNLDNIKNRNSLEFINAEIVKCNQVLDLDMNILSRLIVDLYKLTELHLNIEELYNLNNSPTINGKRTPENAHSRLKIIHDVVLNQQQLRESKLQLKNENFNIFIQGVRIGRDRSYYQYNFFDKLINLHYRFFSLTSIRMPSVRSIDYQDLIEIVQNIKPICFINRYPNLQEVSFIMCDCHHTHVLEFLKYFSNISYLIIQFTRFTNEFFDELPKISSLNKSLNHLVLLEREKLNLDFLFKFEFLHHLTTDQCTKSNLIDLISKFKDHGSYEFFFLHINTLFINKIRSNKYDLVLKQNIIDPLSATSPNSASHYEMENLICLYENVFKDQTQFELENLINENSHLLSHWFDSKI